MLHKNQTQCHKKGTTSSVTTTDAAISGKLALLFSDIHSQSLSLGLYSLSFFHSEEKLTGSAKKVSALGERVRAFAKKSTDVGWSRAKFYLFLST